MENQPTQQITTVESKPAGAVQKLSKNASPMQMISAAVQQQAPIEYIKELMDLQERYEANEARKQFNEAKALFKANPPKVLKDKHNKQYGSMYASISNLVNTVNPELSKYGLSASWDQDQESVPGQIKVTCILSHVAGHSERTSMIAPPDSSGQKNPIQQIKSTVTYLRIATFESITGIASEEGSLDDDGNNAGQGGAQYITEDQQTQLRDLIDEIKTKGIAFQQDAFLRACKAESLDTITAASFNGALNALKMKLKA